MDKSFKNSALKDEKGQTFLEFILLFMVLLSFSYIVLFGINGQLADRWKLAIEVIAKPTEDPIEFPN